MLVEASIGSFFDAVGSFVDSLSRVGWLPLLCGAAIFVLYLTLERALFNTLRASYPADPFRRIWGADIAAYGIRRVHARAAETRGQLPVGLLDCGYRAAASVAVRRAAAG